MADLIQVKASDDVGTTFLADRELAYVRNDKTLYIGDGGRRCLLLSIAGTIPVLV